MRENGNRVSVMCIVGACILLAPSYGVDGQTPSNVPVRSVSLLRTVGNDDNQVTVGRVQNFVVSDKGLLYILDSSDYDVKVFDVEGKFIRKFGRRGRGPGELERPIGFRMSDSSITVMDQANGSVEFSFEGRHIITRGAGTLQHEGTAMRFGFRFMLGPPLGGSPIIRPGQPLPPDVNLYVVEILGPTRADTIATYPADIVRWRSNSRVTLRPAGFGNGGAAAPLGDSMVVVADGLAGTVKLFSIEATGPMLRRTEKLEQVQQQMSAADVKAAEARLESSTGYFGAPPPSLAGTIENPPKFWSLASKIFTSPNGDFWVGAPRDFMSGLREKRKRIIENNTWTVFPAKGTRYRVSLPPTEPIFGVYSDYVFTIPQLGDEAGIHVYRVK